MEDEKEESSKIGHEFGLKIANQALLQESRKRFINGNLVFSPMSISVMLNLLAATSKGDPTTNRFLRSLGFETLEQVNAKSQQMINSAAVGEGGGGPLVSFVNGIWCNKHLAFKPHFEQIVRELYKGETKRANITYKFNEYMNIINKWGEEATRGLIDEIVSKQYVNVMTNVILSSALYFKGTWLSPFDERDTHLRRFHPLDQKPVEVPFMCRNRRTCLYGKSKGFKVIELPYKFGTDKTRRFSMHFFLPDRRDGLLDLVHLISSSNPEFFGQQLDSLRIEKLNRLMIPRFKFSCALDVKVTMRQLGFDIDPLLPHLDMVQMYEKTWNVSPRIQDITLVHKSSIEVHERGTETAATSLGLIGGSDPLPLDFIADHPFVFALREVLSGIVFFVGVVVNPRLT